jgi:ABC-type transporter Mla subunit MlaD
MSTVANQSVQAEILHDKMTRGGILTPDEERIVAEWYTETDLQESLAVALPPLATQLPMLRVQLDTALTQLTAVAAQVQTATSENERLRQETARLRQQLGQLLTPQLS